MTEKRQALTRNRTGPVYGGDRRFTDLDFETVNVLTADDVATIRDGAMKLTLEGRVASAASLRAILPEPELKGCAWDGCSGTVFLAETTGQDYYIKCAICHTQGPIRTTPALAREAWNEEMGR